MTVRGKSKLITLRQITQFEMSSLQQFKSEYYCSLLIQKIKVKYIFGSIIKINNQLYFIKNNLSTLTDFKIYIFSTVHLLP